MLDEKALRVLGRDRAAEAVVGLEHHDPACRIALAHPLRRGEARDSAPDDDDLARRGHGSA